MTKGQIITFYSYKGGVGRTMALANVAVLLARWGYKTLIVDWDLEAPGVEHFFFEESKIKQIQERQGIVDLLDTVNRRSEIQSNLSWKDLLINVPTSDKGDLLQLLTAGQRKGEYFNKLRSFDIDTFYAEKHGGNFVETLRNDWKESFDFILVDSRTGITDISGICTIQLPDILILLFTATEQGLNGVINVAKKALAERQRLPVDRLRLLSVPIPSKFDTDKEFQLGQQWLRKFADGLSDIYSDWLPKNSDVHKFLEITKLPYIPYFSFGEKLAVKEQGVSDPSGLGYAYETLAAIIANKLESIELVFDDREKFVSEAELRPLKTSSDLASILINRPSDALLVADSSYEEAISHEKEDRFDEAAESAKKAVEIWEKLVETDFGTLDPKLARAKRLLSDYFSRENDIFNAIGEASGAVTIYNKLRENKTSLFDEELASELIHLADLFIANNQFIEALENAEEAVDIYRQLVNIDKDRYGANLAHGLNLMSEGLFNTGKFEDSLATGKEAIDMLRTLNRIHSTRYRTDFASSLNTLLDHISQLDETQIFNSIALAKEAVEDFRELAVERPKQYLPEFAKNLNLLAELILKQDYFDDDSLKKALVLQKESINIIRSLVQSNPSLAEPELARSLVNLSKLQRENSEFSEAQKAASEALEIFSRLAKINPKRYEEEIEGINSLLNDLKTHFS
jgi:Asp-tRNA(Asn)/Glu-tRNA(Gln) amidotransferase C subunit